MIEIDIKKYIESKLNIPVYLEFPKEPPIEFILFEKTGSRKSNHLQSSTFAFQSYSDSLYKSAVLNNKLKECLDNMVELKTISKISLNSDYNFTDREQKRYRYQAVYDIYHY